MNAYAYIPEIDLMLRGGHYGLLADRADADIDAAHITLALAEAVRLLQSELEAKEAELEEAYAEQARMEELGDEIAEERDDAKACAEELADALRACSGERRVGDWRVLAADALEAFARL